MEPKKFENEKHKAKIIDRIRKCMALANGTRFEGEANTAMSMAQNYMKTYGLSMSEIELKESLEEEIVYEEVERKISPKTWEAMLSRIIGLATDCKAIRKGVKGTKGASWVVSFIGYKQDVEMAKTLYMLMRQAIRRAGHALYHNDSNARTSFYIGVVQRLGERVVEEKQTNKTESSRYALVVQEKTQRVDVWAKEKLHLVSTPERKTRLDPDAYRQGRSHANTMDLHNRSKVGQGSLRIGHSK